MEHQPLVTVYIPTYNRVDLLKRAVESVQAQTYQNLEIIIVDDCSTDFTHQYLQQLANEDKRVKYFIKEKNSGACVSRNIAIENATGEFITGLDDDDFFLESRIDEFMKKRQYLNKYTFLSSKYLYKVKKDGPYKKTKNLFITKKVKKDDLLFNNVVGNQVFIKTKVLRENLFNEELPLWQDLYCWYSLLLNCNRAGYILNTANYVVDISHEHERMTENKKKKVLYVYEKFRIDFELTRKQKKILFCQLEHYGYLISVKDILFAYLFNINLRTTYVTLSRLKKVLNRNQ